MNNLLIKMKYIFTSIDLLNELFDHSVITAEQFISHFSFITVSITKQ